MLHYLDNWLNGWCTGWCLYEPIDERDFCENDPNTFIGNGLVVWTSTLDEAICRSMYK
jgi:hypothetical protein